MKCASLIVLVKVGSGDGSGSISRRGVMPKLNRARGQSSAANIGYDTKRLKTGPPAPPGDQGRSAGPLMERPS